MEMITIRQHLKLAALQEVQKGKKLDQNILQNVGGQIVNLFELISKSTAKERKHGKHDDSLDQQIKKAEKRLKSYGAGLSQSVLEDIMNMAWSAAWHTANTRAGFWYKNDASSDKEQFNQRATSVANSGYFTNDEFFNLKWCSWNLAWYHAN